MRYKGCRQAHNAQVLICSLFTTRNSLKFTGAAKGVFTHPQSSCHIAKVVLTIRHDSRQIPIASDARPFHTSRGFLHWRFAYAGPHRARRTPFLGPAAPKLHNKRLVRRSNYKLYSITLSARASSVAGTSMPSVVAVFRLITSSNLTGLVTGRSAGFSPFRTRPV